jgi:hypothetical protein
LAEIWPNTRGVSGELDEQISTATPPIPFQNIIPQKSLQNRTTTSPRAVEALERHRHGLLLEIRKRPNLIKGTFCVEELHLTVTLFNLRALRRNLKSLDTLPRLGRLFVNFSSLVLNAGLTAGLKL